MSNHDKEWAKKYLKQKIDLLKIKEKAEHKSKSVMKYLMFIGTGLLLLFIQFTSYDFQFSWMNNFNEWANEFFLAFVVYIITFDIETLVKKRLNLDRYALCNILLPFFRVLLTIIVSKTVSVTFKASSSWLINMFKIIIAVLLFMGFLILFSIGKEKGKKETDELEEALKLLE